MNRPTDADWDLLNGLRDTGRAKLTRDACEEIRDHGCLWPGGWYFPGDPKPRCTMHAATVARRRGLA